MQENQNAFQNAGQNGYSYFNYHFIGNQGSIFFLLILAFILLAHYSSLRDTTASW